MQAFSCLCQPSSLAEASDRRFEGAEALVVIMVDPCAPARITQGASLLHGVMQRLRNLHGALGRLTHEVILGYQEKISQCDQRIAAHRIVIALFSQFEHCFNINPLQITLCQHIIDPGSGCQDMEAVWMVFRGKQEGFIIKMKGLTVGIELTGAVTCLDRIQASFALISSLAIVVSQRFQIIG